MTVGTGIAFLLGGMLQPTDILRRKLGPLADTPGFSFIDVMLALVVLTIGILALADLQIVSSRGNTATKYTTAAANIAEQKLEALKGMVYTNIVAETPALVDESGNPPQAGYSGPTFTRQMTVTNNSPVANSKTVKVIVTWTDKAGFTHTVPMSTVISQ